MRPTPHYRPAILTLIGMLCFALATGALAQEEGQEQSKETQELKDKVEDQNKKIENQEEKIDQQEQRQDDAAAELRKLIDEQKQLIDAQQKKLDEAAQHIAAQQQTLETQATEIAQQKQLLADQGQASGEQAQQLNQQAKTIEYQQKSLDQQAEQISQMNTLLVTINNQIAELGNRAPVDSLTQALTERLARLEGSVEALPEIPTNVVEAGSFPGSINIPGTDAAMKIGGRVRLSLVANLSALLVDDRFITAAIPIAGTPDSEMGGRFTLSARASRINFDFRSPTGVGYIRAFIEGDFYGEGNSFRLRHAYGQYTHLLVGQTWTTFSDLEANPVDIDFEGINSKVLFRQPQIRWTQLFSNDMSLAFAIEDPEVEVTGGTGISQVPDVIARFKLPRKRGHLQCALMYRQIRAEQDGVENVIQSVPGWAANVSGDVLLPFLSEDDNINFQFCYGQGIGRYMNDLNAEDSFYPGRGQAGVFDETSGQLFTLDAFGFYLAYQHFWRKSWHSTGAFSLVHVDNYDFQADDSFRRTLRAYLNFVYSPIKRLEIGIQYLWGQRENKDLSKGTAEQIQIASTFQF